MGYGGKMGVRQGVKPSDAINDIFKNGSKYGMECATGTMVIMYKGILDTIGPADFDRAFAKTRLFRWDIKDDDFKAAEKQGKLPGFWPGDHTYFKNPDFDPANSAFQGENVIYLGGGQYFGHGLGIVSEKGVIDSLNDLRKPGAKKTAVRDDFELAPRRREDRQAPTSTRTEAARPAGDKRSPSPRCATRGPVRRPVVTAQRPRYSPWNQKTCPRRWKPMVRAMVEKPQASMVSPAASDSTWTWLGIACPSRRAGHRRTSRALRSCRDRRPRASPSHWSRSGSSRRPRSR